MTFPDAAVTSTLTKIGRGLIRLASLRLPVLLLTAYEFVNVISSYDVLDIDNVLCAICAISQAHVTHGKMRA